MDKLLVLGSDGVVGSHVERTLANRFAEISTAEGIEIASPTGLGQLVQRHVPDWTVYCGACSASSWDEVRPAELAGEAARAAAVAQAVAQTGGRLTVISTDAVFDGPRLYHTEDSPTVGGQPLADAALAVEAAVEATGALVVRTHAFGREPRELGGGFAQRVVTALLAGEPIHADGRRYASPIYAGDLAELLLAAYEGGLRGVYHIAGAERVSQRRFVGELAAALGVDWSIRETPAAQFNVVPERRETSLICRRAHLALAQPMPWLRDGLLRFAASWQGETDRANTLSLERHAVAA